MGPYQRYIKTPLDVEKITWNQPKKHVKTHFGTTVTLLLPSYCFNPTQILCLTLDPLFPNLNPLFLTLDPFFQTSGHLFPTLVPLFPTLDPLFLTLGPLFTNWAAPFFPPQL